MPLTSPGNQLQRPAGSDWSWRSARATPPSSGEPMKPRAPLTAEAPCNRSRFWESTSTARARLSSASGPRLPPPTRASKPNSRWLPLCLRGIPCLLCNCSRVWCSSGKGSRPRRRSKPMARPMAIGTNACHSTGAWEGKPLSTAGPQARAVNQAMAAINRAAKLPATAPIRALEKMLETTRPSCAAAIKRRRRLPEDQWGQGLAGSRPP